MNYDYKCTKCNSELTIERSIHEEVRPPTCFDCHSSMDRVWSAPSISFKGTGWGHQ